MFWGFCLRGNFGMGVRLGFGKAAWVWGGGGRLGSVDSTNHRHLFELGWVPTDLLNV